MWEDIKAHWKEFKQDEPGRRFLHRHLRHRASRFGRTLAGRALVYVGAPLLMLAGVAMMLGPGPGAFVFLAGVALLASEWRFAARVLDAAELATRPLLLRVVAAWGRMPVFARVGLVLAGFGLSVAMAWVSLRMFAG